jgi:hypothetical protein
MEKEGNEWKARKRGLGVGERGCEREDTERVKETIIIRISSIESSLIDSRKIRCGPHTRVLAQELTL